MENKNTSWGKVSDWYDNTVEDADSYQQKVILPNLLRIVAPKTGVKILDVGCGTGIFSRAFAEKGAKVLGVDIGKELVDIAEKKSTLKHCVLGQALKHGVLGQEQYMVASADDLSKIKEKDFDVATIVLAIQNMKNLDAVAGEVNKKIKSGGKLVLVMNHPAFRIPQNSDWYYDEKEKIQYRKIARYMSEIEIPILMNPGNKNSKKTYSFHRPLQVYVKSLAKNGFAITKLEEWISHKESQKGPKKNIEDKSRKEIPMFMCIECTKA
jgi:ubiquinone/menaquinone biosynthesis C-methylase UbiE